MPQPTLALVVQNFPTELVGNLTYAINSTQGNPKKAGGQKRKYTVTLDHLVLRLTSVKGDNRQTTYKLVSAHQAFDGFEDITHSKCKTTHIVWDGSGRAPAGAVAIYSPKFDASVGFVFNIFQRGATATRPCGTTRAGDVEHRHRRSRTRWDDSRSASRSSPRSPALSRPAATRSTECSRLPALAPRSSSVASRAASSPAPPKAEGGLSAALRVSSLPVER